MEFTKIFIKYKPLSRELTFILEFIKPLESTTLPVTSTIYDSTSVLLEPTKIKSDAGFSIFTSLIILLETLTGSAAVINKL